MTGRTSVRPLGIAIVAVLGAAAGLAGARYRFFDYDEIYHAHVTWLIAQGDRPFHDFFASHSPFLWYPIATLWRVLPEAPSTLFALRAVAMVGTALSIVTMAAAWAAARRDVPRPWLLMGIGVVAVTPAVLDLAIEFRPDGWSTALLFFACALFLRERPASIVLRCAVFASLAGVAVLTSPKFFLLPLLCAAIDLLARLRRGSGLGAALLGYVAGGSAAVLAAAACLRIAGVDALLAFQMAVRYQWAFATHSAFGLGLLARVLDHPMILTLVIAGVVAWGVDLASTRRRPQAFETAVLLFLVAQLLVVDRPYKQYSAPWFLLASCFVPFIGVVVERRFATAAPWCFGAAVLLGAGSAAGAWQAFARDPQAPRMLAFYDALLSRVPVESPIIAYPPLHPVVRRDVFYGWNRTTDPAGRGTEDIMRRLQVRGYSERFAPAHYARELAARAPGMILAPASDDWGYEPGQWSAVRAYLISHRDDFVLVERGVPARAWVRRALVQRGVADGAP